jgi:hypothetical protein
MTAGVVTESEHAETTVPGGPAEPHQGLWSTSFVALLVVQFCTAFNDNAFRWLVVPIAKPILGDEAALARWGSRGSRSPFCSAPDPPDISPMASRRRRSSRRFG